MCGGVACVVVVGWCGAVCSLCVCCELLRAIEERRKNTEVPYFNNAYYVLNNAHNVQSSFGRVGLRRSTQVRIFS